MYKYKIKNIKSCFLTESFIPNSDIISSKKPVSVNKIKNILSKKYGKVSDFICESKDNSIYFSEYSNKVELDKNNIPHQYFKVEFDTEDGDFYGPIYIDLILKYGYYYDEHNDEEELSKLIIKYIKKHEGALINNLYIREISKVDFEDDTENINEFNKIKLKFY